MQRLTAYLGRRKTLTAALVAVYSVATITAHDVAQDVVFWMQDLFSPRLWLRWVAIGSAVAALAGAVWLVRTVRRRSDAAVLTAYGLLTLALAGLCYVGLMMVSNESIHFAQYALLAILVYPLTRRFGETVIWCTLIGALDESYQYLVLHSNWGSYLDLNDVILNCVGAGFGVVVLRATLPPQPRPPLATLARSPGVIATAAVLAAAALAGLAGYVHVLPDPNATGLVLRRGGPSPGNWVITEFGKGFHEVQPWEGLVAILALLALYHGLDLLAPAAEPATEPNTRFRARVAEAPEAVGQAAST